MLQAVHHRTFDFGEMELYLRLAQGAVQLAQGVQGGGVDQVYRLHHHYDVVNLPVLCHARG